MTINDFLDYSNIIRERKIRFKNKRKFSLKRYYIDELGFSNLRNNGFNPCYNYYLKDDKLIIRLEAPGNVDIKIYHKITEKFNIIEIKGEKRIDKEPKNIEDIIFNGREFGEFSIDIPLMMNIDNKKPNIKKDEGIFFLEFSIKKNTNTIYKYEGKDEEI